MKNLEEAKKSLMRVTFNEEQRKRSQLTFEAADKFLDIMWQNTKPSSDLTLACRAVEEAVMWHSKAIANENK